MRIFIIIFTTLAFGPCFAQQADKKFTFKEVGWTFTLPSEFIIIDSADNAERNERGKKAMEEANDIKADISQTKTLISATKNTYNYFNSTITPFDTKKDGNYIEANQGVKDMVYNTFSVKMPDAKIDSSTTSITIDGLTFDKFKITITVNDKVLFNMILLTKFYKGFDFGISYLYLDEATKEQIETILGTSKFSK